MSYFKNLLTTGALGKTPERVIKKIVTFTQPQPRLNIIEFGSGKGEITTRVLKKVKDSGSITYYAFETNGEFAASIRNINKDLIVFNTDAMTFSENIEKGLLADLFISSLPLSYFPSKKLNNFCKELLLRCNRGGKIIFLFHAPWFIPFLKKRFTNIQIDILAHLPPYFLMVYTNENQ